MQKRYLFVVLALTISFLFLPGAAALHTESEQLAECADPEDLDGKEDGSGNETENETSSDNETSLLGTIESTYESTYNETTSDVDEAVSGTGGCVYDEVPETWNCDRIQGRNACIGTNTENCRLQIIYGLGFCIIF